MRLMGMKIDWLEAVLLGGLVICDLGLLSLMILMLLVGKN